MLSRRELLMLPLALRRRREPLLSVSTRAMPLARFHETALAALSKLFWVRLGKLKEPVSPETHEIVMELVPK